MFGAGRRYYQHSVLAKGPTTIAPWTSQTPGSVRARARTSLSPVPPTVRQASLSSPPAAYQSSSLAVHLSSPLSVANPSPLAARQSSQPAAHSSPPFVGKSCPLPLAVHSSTPSTSHMPLGMLVEYEGMSWAPDPERPLVTAPQGLAPVSAPAPELTPVQALAPDQSQVMYPEIFSTGTILVGLVMSVGVPEKWAASLVMAAEAIPKPPASPVASIEAVPECTPEEVPVTPFSPRRCCGSHVWPRGGLRFRAQPGKGSSSCG
ncbi:helicase SRCAP-like [Onychostoma macrolepis]|uniref:helicase SRCAP-like n=1 Tax=Onychostoma macrolepis TaxID=369639 RepID=UPI00272C6CD8|nr:helicase SRCAP-like [Onychostoma macrolepis]XP_058617655.1 helicase SRCAP-like [Onychostoma macrolepis]XP_058617662.1 helicase SRCAP-like [Onychostoma macrolepis]